MTEKQRIVMIAGAGRRLTNAEVIKPTDRVLANYIMGEALLEGYATYIGEGLYEFTTEERLAKGRKSLILSASDLKFTGKMV